jgi:hypothetical protein
MSIKKADIQFKTVQNKDKSTTFYAHINVNTNRTVTELEKSLTKNPQLVINEMIKQMEAAMMHHIYGDLVIPVNNLAVLASYHLASSTDAEELRELREKLTSLIRGEEDDL